MKNTFMDGVQYNEDGPETYGPQVGKLRKDFYELIAGNVPEEDAVAFVCRLMEQPRYFGGDKKLLLWAVGEPSEMPSDAREEFIYQPTYLATAFIVYAVLHYDAVKNISGLFPFLHDALAGCLGRSFGGHGYDYVEGLIDTMNIFADCGMGTFLEKYPQVNTEFKDAFDGTVKYIEEKLCTGKERNQWNNQSYESVAVPLLKKLKPADQPQLLFVYGTLMRGGRAENRLSGSEFLGKAVLYNYAMFDLGNYPGIVAEKDEWVEGELYNIRSSDFANLDWYESEGDLYHRGIVTVECASYSLQTWAYIFNGKPKGEVMHEPWIKNDDDVVWYAGYGSNLSKKRFMRYIKKCHINHLISDDEDHAWFPGQIYFGNKSGRWNHKGVAFYDPNVPGKTYMRMYKVTRQQLEEIQDNEGRGFYGRKQNLGIHPDGCPIYTFTSETRFESNSSDESYFSLILQALTEENRFAETEANRYLDKCLNN